MPMQLKSKSLWAALAAGVAVLALLAWSLAPRPVDVDAALVVEGPFEQTITEEAKTRLSDPYVVSAPLAGRVARIALREGDAVQAGDVVATLSPMLAPMLDERSQREHAARAQAAQALVLRAEARVNRAKVTIDQAAADLRRDEALAADGFVSSVRVETDRLAAAAAQRELEAALQERNAAAHDLQQARAAIGAFQGAGNTASGRDFVLRAPISGRVLHVLQPSAASVAIGTPLIELGDLDRLEVVAELLTTDALRARPGKPVRIDRWGGNGPLAARVRHVEPAAFTKVSALGVEEQRVKVIIDITSPRELWRELGDGFRVDVQVIVLAAPKVVKAPSSAVFPRPGGAAGEMAAFVVEEGRARLTGVSVKARNGSEAWVSDGLAPGAQVLIYPPAAVSDGVRVRVRGG